MSLQGALSWASVGWAVFPVNPQNKRPITEHGVLEATTDEAQIRAWWGQWPHAGIGIAAGKSGLVIIDLDPPKHDGDVDGREAFIELVATYAGGAGPTTFAVRSRRGGVHLYFAAPAEPAVPLRPSQSRIARNIDVRAAESYVVAPPTEGYTVVENVRPAEMPAWLLELVEEASVPEAPRKPEGPVVSAAELTEAQAAAVPGYVEATLAGIRADLQESATWRDGQVDAKGRGWEKLQADKAFRLARLALAEWNAYSLEQAEQDFLAWAPIGGGWDERERAHKWATQVRAAQRKGPEPLPAGLGEDRGSIFDDVALRGATSSEVDPSQPPADGSGAEEKPKKKVREKYDDEVNVSNPAVAFSWLSAAMGAGKLSGIFVRGGALTFAGSVTETGYAESTCVLAPVTKDALASRVQRRYKLVRRTEDGWQPALLPMQAAAMAIAAPDELANVRELEGVVHSPVVRPDGTLLDQPGYDPATRLLYVPEGPQPPAVPAVPGPDHLEHAQRLLGLMLGDFAFVTPGDQANYVGLMLTPLLRLPAPPPYKLAVIEAHQPGSGKSYLGRALISLHGGAEKPEMPATEEEFGKQIAAILDAQTGGIFMFDNISGTLRSSVFAGLLTAARFTARRLGTNSQIDVPNDRLWVVTSNNAVIGGDLARRVIRVMIDPGVDRPDLRTDFRIPNFEPWVREHRGEILWALLVLIRHWYAQGCPRRADTRGDSYGQWVSTVDGVLYAAGFTARFDQVSPENQIEDEDAAELADFIASAKEVFGTGAFTVKDYLAKVSPVDGVVENLPLSLDRLPGTILERYRGGAITSLSRTLGKWIAFRKGRFVNGERIVDTGERFQRYVLWRVEAK